MLEGFFHQNRSHFKNEKLPLGSGEILNYYYRNRNIYFATHDSRLHNFTDDI